MNLVCLFFKYFFFFFFLRSTQKFKMTANDFCEEKFPVDSADTLRIKNFVKIALSHSVSEINAFLRLTQKF